MSSKISEVLKFDDKNFNVGTENGQRLIDQSIAKFGYREACVIDKEGNIIGGNKRTQSAIDNGIEEVEIIKAVKGKVYALQFDDIELDSPEGRELALALNATAKENINFDEAIIFEVMDQDLAYEWGVFNDDFNEIDYSKKNKEIDESDFKDEMLLSFKLREEEFNFVKNKLNTGGAETMEYALLNLLGYGKR